MDLLAVVLMDSEVHSSQVYTSLRAVQTMLVLAVAKPVAVTKVIVKKPK